MNDVLSTVDRALMPVQKILVANQAVIRWIFRLVYIAILGAYVAGVMAYKANPENEISLYLTGTTIGQAALICYVVTLLPGMLKRFGILPMTRTMLMMFRRQWGVTMFLLAFLHGAYTTTIAYGFGPQTPLPVLQSHHVWGLVSLWILFPLWLTSNDLSKKKLGKWWSWVHRLTYIAMWTIFGHLALIGTTWRILLGIVIALEIGSAGTFWYTKNRAQSSFPKEENNDQNRSIPN
jgi:DMSO/TMAO reductase YedYZ heme-binding membrane subunit